VLDYKQFVADFWVALKAATDKRNREKLLSSGDERARATPPRPRLLFVCFGGLRHCDSQNLPQAIRWQAEALVRNVKRAIWAEGHGRGEEESRGNNCSTAVRIQS
jgi:hypothetical protein